MINEIILNSMALAPVTGDSAKPVLVAICLIVSVILMVVLIITGKSSKHDDSDDDEE